MGTTVEANNINIWYEEFGDRSNETILLIMGANANCMQWDQEFIDRLVANNFHVVRFDNRDVGKSTWFGKEPAFNKFLKLLPNFLLRIIVNSIFGLAVDDKGKFKFNTKYSGLGLLNLNLIILILNILYLIWQKMQLPYWKS